MLTCHFLDYGNPFCFKYLFLKGPQEADRILNYMIAFPPLRPLTLVIKQFLAQRGMNEVYTGGLGSYAVLLMTMNFLQQHPVRDVATLPPTFKFSRK